MAWPGSCAVDGATSTTGPRPGGGATRSPGGSHSSGPTSRSHGAHVARVLELRQRRDERERAREPGVDVRQRAEAQPRAAVVVLAPALLEAARDERVERAPGERAERGPRQPGAERIGREARRRPRVHVRDERRDRHAAQLRGERGAGVRMSETAISGAKSRTDGTVARAARTAAANGASGCSRVGNTWYSGAAANVIPAAVAGSSQRRHVCSATVWPRATSASPSASIGNAWPGSPNAPR